MNVVRVLFAAILFVATAFLAPAQATSFSTDQSDLWWVPNESGWGIQLVQRGSVIFATMFVYDPSGNPIWYTATLNPQAAALNWAGDLYVTNGPWFGTGTFNPNLVGLRKVGTMTWYAQYVEAGVLTYSVDGVPVSKFLVRQLLVYDNFGGTFVGAVHETTTGCPTASENGTTEFFADVNIAQSGQNITVTAAREGGTGSCTWSGVLTQGGQFGKTVGNYSCTSGASGNFNMYEINVGHDSFTARYTSSSGPCQFTGYLGGIRHRAYSGEVDR
jgi:hypothetical protein